MKNRGIKNDSKIWDKGKLELLPPKWPFIKMGKLWIEKVCGDGNQDFGLGHNKSEVPPEFEFGSHHFI